MHVELSQYVEPDLQEIGDFIARDNPARALSFVEELRREVWLLGDHPHGYQLRPDIGKGARLAVYGQYLLVFRIVHEVVYVERVVHGARNLKRLAI